MASSFYGSRDRYNQDAGHLWPADFLVQTGGFGVYILGALYGLFGCKRIRHKSVVLGICLFIAFGYSRSYRNYLAETGKNQNRYKKI